MSKCAAPLKTYALSVDDLHDLSRMGGGVPRSGVMVLVLVKRPSSIFGAHVLEWVEWHDDGEVRKAEHA